MFIRLPEDFVVPIVYKDNFKFNDTNTVKESIRSLEYISEDNTNKKNVEENSITRNNPWQQIDVEYIYNSLNRRENINHVINAPITRVESYSSIFQHIDEEYINDYTK